jgi:hypothetical protein
MKLSILQRRPVLLLEVLIAFALIALCALPLIYPHVFMLRSEKKYVAAVELDHYVNLLFVNTLQRLYQNEVPWSEIEGGKPVPIGEVAVQSVGYGENLPFEGTYQFEQKDKKISQDGTHAAYVFNLIYRFKSKKGAFLEKGVEEYKYEYLVPVERKIK